MPHFHHTLIVGGTGMLRRATLALAADSERLTVVGRTPSRLAEVVRQGPGNIYPLAVDYCDVASFDERICAAMDARGPFDLVVAWIHSSAPTAATALASQVASRARRPVPFYDLLGSAAVDPTRNLDERRTLFGRPQLVYRTVVLGFVLEAAGSRWLTDEEISAGVLEAVEKGRPLHVVGVVRPWSRRP